MSGGEIGMKSIFIGRWLIVFYAYIIIYGVNCNLYDRNNPADPKAGNYTKPEMSIALNGTDIPSGGNTDLGYMFVSDPQDVDFTIENRGNASLAISNYPYHVSISGNDAAYFSVVTQPETVVPPGGSTVFTVRFNPEEFRNYSAVLTLGNNDPARSSYAINIVTQKCMKRTASDGNAGDNFGNSVAIDGNYAIVGAIYDDDSHISQGSAYIYFWDGEKWTQQAKLTSSAPSTQEYFGSSVSISGDYAVVGAEGYFARRGRAYVFMRSGTTWSEIQVLSVADTIGDTPAEFDSFGCSVAISGNYLIVGTLNKQAAYIYSHGTTWKVQNKLSGGSAFGATVSLCGDHAIVGAYGVDSYKGAAYVFKRNGTDWSISPQTLTADDGVANAIFGRSVSIYGDFALVGANGANSGNGAAYVFARNGNSWVQQSKISASDGANGDEFGTSVSIWGNKCVVGAYRDDNDMGIDSGSAYVYYFDGSGWSLLRKITARDGGVDEYFGTSVALSGSILLVGARHFDDGGASGATGSVYFHDLFIQEQMGIGIGYSAAIDGDSAIFGRQGTRAHVFTRGATGWAESALLEPGDGVTSGFGKSVGISGDVAVVGNSYHEGTGGITNAGAAYVFRRSCNAWSQEQMLTASDAAQGDYFGNSVGVSGDFIIAGADLKNSQRGAAYMYRWSGSTWSETKLADGGTGERLGISVAINGDRAIIGGEGYSSYMGAAYIFHWNGSNWIQQPRLTASDAFTGHSFGCSVDIDGNWAIIGAYSKDSQKGAAYIFFWDGSSWSQQQCLTAQDGAAGDYFGNSVAISGNCAIVGANFDDNTKGAAYLYVWDGTTWNEERKMTKSDAAISDYFGDVVALSGNYALIGAEQAYSYQGAGYIIFH
jgi:hypothetical protein